MEMIIQSLCQSNEIEMICLKKKNATSTGLGFQAQLYNFTHPSFSVAPAKNKLTVVRIYEKRPPNFSLLLKL
jgi:hypothetical protein